MPPPGTKPSGLILAGGGAVRLGGGDKTLLRLGAGSLLGHLQSRLSVQCGPMILNANGDPARFAAFRLPVVADHPEDRDAGPLAGLLAGLDWLAEQQPDAMRVLTVPGDTPFIPADLATRLCPVTADDPVVFCATSGGRTHPLVASWPISLRHDLRNALRRDHVRRVAAFLQRHRVIWTEWPDKPFDPFFNINTPAELDQARAWPDACS